MEKVKVKKPRDPQRVKFWNYTLITIVGGCIIMALIHPLAEMISQRYSGGITTLLSLLFIICVFIGRYLSTIWTSGQRAITQRLYIVLGSCVVLSAFLIFIQAQSLYSMGEPPIPVNVFFAMVFFSVLGTSAAILIKVTRFSINTQLKEAKATAAQSLTELHFLQSQLSPHFLFNTLNNLYGISLSQQEKIPSMLLKLSDLLRYSVYDAKDLYVPLSDEIAYVKNYIDFERLRIGDRLELDVSIEEVLGNNVKIAPLLLIVFIENAFKHSKNTLSEKIQVNIILKTFGKDILFSVKNSYDPESDISKKDVYKGLGLDNVKKRLELLYPNRFELTTLAKDNVYSVKLQIKE